MKTTKCADCKTADAKFSIDRGIASVALCLDCANRELRKQGREEIRPTKK